MLVEATVEAPRMSRNWFPLLVEINPFCYEKQQSKRKKKPFFFFLPTMPKQTHCYLITEKVLFPRAKKQTSFPLESCLTAPVFPTAVTPDLLRALYDSSLRGCTSADSSKILPVLPCCFQTASTGCPAHPQGLQASYTLSSAPLLLHIDSFGHVSWTRNYAGSNHGLHHVPCDQCVLID